MGWRQLGNIYLPLMKFVQHTGVIYAAQRRIIYLWRSKKKMIPPGTFAQMAGIWNKTDPVQLVLI